MASGDKSPIEIAVELAKAIKEEMTPVGPNGVALVLAATIREQIDVYKQELAKMRSLEVNSLKKNLYGLPGTTLSDQESKRRKEMGKMEEYVDSKHANDPSKRLMEIGGEGTVLPTTRKPEKVASQGSGGMEKHRNVFDLLKIGKAEQHADDGEDFIDREEANNRAKRLLLGNGKDSEVPANPDLPGGKTAKEKPEPNSGGIDTIKPEKKVIGVTQTTNVTESRFTKAAMAPNKPQTSNPSNPMVTQSVRPAGVPGADVSSAPKAAKPPSAPGMTGMTQKNTTDDVFVYKHNDIAEFHGHKDMAKQGMIATRLHDMSESMSEELSKVTPDNVSEAEVHKLKGQYGYSTSGEKAKVHATAWKISKQRKKSHKKVKKSEETIFDILKSANTPNNIFEILSKAYSGPKARLGGKDPRSKMMTQQAFHVGSMSNQATLPHPPKALAPSAPEQAARQSTYKEFTPKGKFGKAGEGPVGGMGQMGMNSINTNGIGTTTSNFNKEESSTSSSSESSVSSGLSKSSVNLCPYCNKELAKDCKCQ